MPVQASTTTIRLAQREANHARSRYDGEISISTGQREGTGKFFYANPYFVYEGDWLAGKKHGQGRLSFDGGGFYEGNFEEGEISGSGTQEWQDGSSYVGRFRLGLKHGEGTWKKADGTLYIGGFEQGRYAGQGKLTLPNGDRYTGSFAAHKYHGDGSLDQPKHDMSYQGQFNMGLRHGDGTLHELGGAAVYLGQFQSGMKHGKGKAVDEASGISYEGAWLEDRPAQFAAAFDLGPAEIQEEVGQSFVPASEFLKEEAANQLNGADLAKDKKGKKGKAPSPEPVPDVGPELKGTRGQALPEIAVRLTDAEKAVVTSEIGRQLRVSVYKEQKSAEDPEDIVRKAVNLGDKRETEEAYAEEEEEEGAEPKEPICEGSETVDGAISEEGNFQLGGSDAWLLPVYLQPAIYFIRVQDITELSDSSAWARMEPLEIPFRVVDP